MKLKLTYVGNCVDSFDEDCQCVNPDLPYKDVTDFANEEEAARRLDVEVFCALCETVGGPDVDIEEVFYHSYVYVVYDASEDVHYFYVNQEQQ